MEVLYKSKDNLVDMDIVETDMYVQRHVEHTSYTDYQNCYVYVSRKGEYYIQVNDCMYNDCYDDEGRYTGKYGILITDLTNKTDIQILNANYETYTLSEGKIKELFDALGNN